MYNINLGAPSENDIKSMFSFLQQNPQFIEQFNKMNQTNQALNYNNNNSANNQNPLRTSLNFILGNNDKERNVNIVFIPTSGRKFNVVAPENMTMKELFKEFVLRIGLTENVIGKDLFFISNGIKVDVNCEETIQQKNIYDGHQILVIDTNNVIGAN
jgi:hypothetical protein